MSKTIGTRSIGIITPIIKQGDDLIEILKNSLIEAVNENNIVLKDKDIIAVTESLVARAQGNYATIEQVAKDIREKFPNDIGIVFPILSRNRFSVVLRALELSGRKLNILLSYPSDEVGNELLDIDRLYELKINPYSDVLSLEQYREYFKDSAVHKFTGVNYVELYKDIVGDDGNIIFANDPKEILKYTKDILVCNVHERDRTSKILKDNGANIVYNLGDILAESVDGSGYNPEYGIMGSNLSSETSIKLFPRDGQKFVEDLQKTLNDHFNVHLEVMIYGDGAFKDPIGHIWELADPVVSPAYTSGLEGTPNEIKIKYVADTSLANLDAQAATKAIKEKILNKEIQSAEENERLGTTPRRITDLLGSLCDLTSGSGDKGTPMVLVQGYFDNFASE
ncbi:MAG: coenzyme F420-0:L-glutamate ligase [Tissierellia bacterium]|nr:coenzyme F420-0:L-glutamate ligase [Tissierellia bacterium]